MTDLKVKEAAEVIDCAVRHSLIDQEAYKAIKICKTIRRRRLHEDVIKNISPLY